MSKRLSSGSERIVAREVAYFVPRCEARLAMVAEGKTVLSDEMATRLQQLYVDLLIFEELLTGEVQP